MLPPLVESVPGILLNSFAFSVVAWLVYVVAKHTFLKGLYRSTLFSAMSILIVIAWHWIWSVFQLFDIGSVEVSSRILIPLQENELPSWLAVITEGELRRSSGILICIVYLAALLWQLYFFLKDAYTIRKLGKLPHQQPQKSISNTLRELAAQIKLSKIPVVRLVWQQIGPLTISLFKPLILYPVATANALSLEETQSILLHELTHIKHKDFYISIVTRLLCMITAFNPWARLLAKEIRFYQEAACDQTVLKYRDQRTYLNALIKVADNQSIKMAMNAQPALLARIQLIYGHQKTSLLQSLRTKWIYITCIPLLYLISYVPVIESNDVSSDIPPSQVVAKKTTYHIAPSHLPMYVQLETPLLDKKKSKRLTKSPKKNKVKKSQQIKSTTEVDYELLASILSKDKDNEQKLNSNKPNKQMIPPFEYIAVYENNSDALYKEDLVETITKGKEWIVSHKYAVLDPNKFEELTPEQAAIQYDAQQKKIMYIRNVLKQKLYHTYSIKQLELLAHNVESTIVALLYLEYQIGAFENNTIQ